jgi:Rrf2 family protein
MVAATGVPDLYFRKLMQVLSRAGVVRITRGPRGGYCLAVPAAELTLLRVVETGSGDLCLNECAVDPAGCGRSGTCVVHPVWQEVRQQVRGTLGRVTFAALARRSGTGQGAVGAGGSAGKPGPVRGNGSAAGAKGQTSPRRRSG